MRDNEWGRVLARIEAAYQVGRVRSRELDSRARGFMPGGDTRTTAYYLPYPIYVERGRGCRITDADGNVYLDFLNNYTSMVLGHAHPAVVEAVKERAGSGQAFAAGLQAQVELAEELCRRLSSVEKVRFCNSGTEAAMFAIRAARAFSGKEKIVKMEGGYHGSYDPLGVSVKPPLDRAGTARRPEPVADGPGIPASVLKDVIVVPFNDLGALEAALSSNQGSVAAVIVEPFLGAAGVIPPEPGYLKGIRRLCDEHDVILVFDEVQSLRLSPGGAQEYFDVVPDLTVMGKIIGGGFPVGAFGGFEDIMEAFSPHGTRRVPHGGTFNGNLLTMVAGLTTLRELDAKECERINRLGETLRAGLAGALEDVGVRGTVTGVGSVLNVHFTAGPVRDYRGAAAANKEVARAVHLSLIQRGIFTAARGAFNISTPMTEAEVQAAVRAFGEVLEDLRPAIERAFPGMAA